MPKIYKLTDGNDQTYGGCQWGENVTHETSGEGNLCDSGWTHWYTDPLLAVMLNPIHGNFDLTSAHLWESPEDQVAEKTDHGLKVGCTRGTTARRIPLPEVTLTQKIAFGLLCALEVYREPSYVAWAESWLSGENRLAWDARVAGEAAWEAPKTAREAAWAAEVETWAETEGAWAAAGAAMWAAAWGAGEAEDIDLIHLARKAMEVV